MDNFSSLLDRLELEKEGADFLVVLNYIWRLIEEDIMYETPITITEVGRNLLAHLTEWEYVVDNEGLEMWADELCGTELTRNYVIDSYKDIRDGKTTFEELVEATKRGNEEDSDLTD
jgi:hypothetical protein